MQHVMRAFAKLQLDEEAAIRTNTTICLGKIASHIDTATREKVLIPACCRALKDPFPPGRAAGLMSLTATQQYHKPIDVATKVLPNIAPVVLDVEREVREQALTCLRVYVQRLEQASARVGMPPQEGGGDAAADSGGSADLSKAADRVLDSMSWLTSKVAAVATGEKGGPGPQGGGGGGGGGPGGMAGGGPGSMPPGGGGGPAGMGGGGMGMGGGAPAAGGGPRPNSAPQQAYKPPSGPPTAAAPAAPAASAGSNSLDGWEDDDMGLNDAFAMPSTPSITSMPSDDAFGLGPPAPAAPTLAPPPAAGAGKGMQLGGGAPAAQPNPVNDIFASMSQAPKPNPTPTIAPPKPQQPAAADPFASFGMSAPAVKPMGGGGPMGSMSGGGGMASGPLGGMGGGGGMMGQMSGGGGGGPMGGMGSPLGGMTSGPMGGQMGWAVWAVWAAGAAGRWEAR